MWSTVVLVLVPPTIIRLRQLTIIASGVCFKNWVTSLFSDYSSASEGTLQPTALPISSGKCGDRHQEGLPLQVWAELLQAQFAVDCIPRCDLACIHSTSHGWCSTSLLLLPKWFSLWKKRLSKQSFATCSMLGVGVNDQSSRCRKLTSPSNHHHNLNLGPEFYWTKTPIRQSAIDMIIKHHFKTPSPYPTRLQIHVGPGLDGRALVEPLHGEEVPFSRLRWLDWFDWKHLFYIYHICFFQTSQSMPASSTSLPLSSSS